MRDRLATIVLTAAATILIGVIVVVVLRNRPDTPTNAAGPEPPANAVSEDVEQPPGDEPDIQVSGTELTIEEEGEVIWRASFGGEIDLNEQRNVARATDVTWQFEGRGFTGLTLTAPVMRADWNQGRLYFSDGIVVEGDTERLRFSAEKAEYQFDTHKVIGRGNVRFQRGSFSGRAEEVVVDNDRRIVRLKRGSLTRWQ